jgi:Raf kinase inhibitor-like YbhB/YbcL family protein
MIRHPEVQTDYKVLTVSSKAFQPNGFIPKKYTCEGYNTNPPIDISGIPEHAKSLVLFMEDPDAPGKTFIHWVLWNLPVKNHIQEDELTGDQGVNDFGDRGYGGPCPPSGTHRYYIKIYALNELLDIPHFSTKETVEHAMEDHIIAYGELMGRYSREDKR